MRARGERKGAQVDADMRRAIRIGARAKSLARSYPMCRVCDLDIVATAQILFFGDSHTDLSTFVLEDLGMLRFESYQLDARHRQFGERAELDDFLAMRALRGTPAPSRIVVGSGRSRTMCSTRCGNRAVGACSNACAPIWSIDSDAAPNALATTTSR